jgi:PAS domain S-box-containing protein
MTHENADMISWFKGIDAFTPLVAADAPAFVIKSHPFSIVAANTSALALFSQIHEQALTDFLQTSTDIGARRLRDLAANTKPVLPRLERLRFILRGSSELVTFLCAKSVLNGEQVLLGAAMALQPNLQKDVDAAKLAMLAARDVTSQPVVSAIAKPLRFLFQTDAAGCIIQISPEFANIGLVLASDAIGKNLSDLIPGADVADALVRRKTWRLEGVFWPLQDRKREVPVTLAASPMQNAEQNFCGYRGFGIVQFENSRHIETGLALEAEAVQAEAVAGPWPVSTSVVTVSSPVQSEAASPSLLSDNVVSLHPERASTDRPAQARDMDIAPLSAAERLAFREIAKALGAKIEIDEPVPSLPRSSLVAETVPLTASASHVLGKALETFARGEPALETVTAAPTASHKTTPPIAIFDGLALGIWVIQDAAPVYANAALLALLGFDRTGDFSPQERCKLSASALHPQQSWQAPVSLIGHKGETLSFDIMSQDFLWNDAPALLIFILHEAEVDLKPRLKLMEMDLRAREVEARELHGILDTATDGIVVLDDTGHILAINRSAEALLGYEQTDVLGASFTVLLAGESHATALDYLDGLKSNGVASVLNDGRDVLGRERNGGLVPMFMTLGRVGQGANAKFCAVLRDVTHWKKAECELRDARQEAERANEQKSNFLAKISHEIRTPLNAILGFTEVIWQERFGPIGNERYKEYLKDIHASGSLVMSLVNDLLDLSKIEAGKLDLSFVSVNANAILQDCVALIQPQATKERVIIRVSLAPRLPNIVADERSLRQILINLLSNAVKFNEPGGQVIVSTALTDAGHAVIRIRDTGIGMNEGDVERALEPFRQLETSRKNHGTGLGLPLTKAMVEANRASFTIKSKRGEGTLAEVTFPPTRVLAE